MRIVALVEHDGLLREVLRERLEREGFDVCAVATVRAAVEGSQWSTFVAILLGASTASGATAAQREALAALRVPVLLLHRPLCSNLRAPDGVAAVESLVWSCFDLEPVVQAVLRRALPGEAEPSPSGTYRRSSSAGVVAARKLSAPAGEARREGVAVPLDAAATLGALGALVLEATGTRSK